MTGLPGGADPFAALGLPARDGLTDDEIRSAWRRVAAATHPDRADGGNPGRFAAAAAAYTVLRTRSGRGEALADLRSSSPVPGRPGTAWLHPGRPRPGQPGAAWPHPGQPRPGQPRPGQPRPGQPRPGRPGTPPRPGPGLTGLGAARLLSRIRRGRPGRLALRVLITVAVSAVAVAVAGSRPATPALITGALTWLLLTARHDLAPPS
jgi:curved DNA-binding protein CbpA